MSITFNCAGCSEQYTVDDSLAGKKGRCHRCGSFYDIPHQSAPQAAGFKAPSVYGFTPPQGGAAPKRPKIKYPTLYEDKISSRQKSRLMPLAIVLLLGLALTAYLHRDFLHSWFVEHEGELKEELEHVKEKPKGQHEKEEDKAK